VSDDKYGRRPFEDDEEEENKNRGPTKSQKIEKAGNLTYDAGFLMMMGGWLSDNKELMNMALIVMTAGLALLFMSLATMFANSDEEMKHSKQKSKDIDREREQEVNEHLSATSHSPSSVILHSNVGALPPGFSRKGQEADQELESSDSPRTMRR
jgi:di/tricarboxylate transporter